VCTPNFEYQCDGDSSWSDVVVSNTRPFINLDELKVVYLKPTDKIRFALTGNELYTNFMALESASVTFLAWDQTDNKTCGVHTVNVTKANQEEFLSSFKSAALLKQMREGCDGTPGTVGQIDACGVCEGDNSTCTDCNDQVNGNKVLDVCLQCTDPSTPTVLDCAGTCNKSREDSCGFCQVYGFETKRDCNNECNGEAVIGDCGICVLGSTGKSKDFGRDLCGVCNGTNSTCLDCANVPNGKNMTDLCGNCLQPDDPDFNKLCGVSLGKFEPTVGYTGGMDIHIEASSVEDIQNLTCTFNGFQAARTLIINGTIRATTPASLPSGRYNISCVLQGKVQSNETAQGQLQLINMSKISISEISPQLIERRSKHNLTITGSGFVPTPELLCHYGDLNTVLETTFVSSEEIICHLPRVLTGTTGRRRVFLSFAEHQREERARKLTVHHDIGLALPIATSAQFGRRLDTKVVKFNGNIQNLG
jgi:hypothetical protein